MQINTEMNQKAEIAELHRNIEGLRAEIGEVRELAATLTAELFEMTALRGRPNLGPLMPLFATANGGG